MFDLLNKDNMHKAGKKAAYIQMYLGTYIHVFSAWNLVSSVFGWNQALSACVFWLYTF